MNEVSTKRAIPELTDVIRALTDSHTRLLATVRDARREYENPPEFASEEAQDGRETAAWAPHRYMETHRAVAEGPGGRRYAEPNGVPVVDGYNFFDELDVRLAQMARGRDSTSG